MVISIALYFNVKNSGNDNTKRSFLMGLSLFPYDYTPKAISETKKIVEKHADLVTIPIEKGVPWEEAKDKKPYSENIKKQIDSIVETIPSGKKVILTVSPFNSNKDSLADDWNNVGNEGRTGEFIDIKLSDDRVIMAYTNYLTDLIKTSNADIIIYAPEVNTILEKAFSMWADFEIFSAKVYNIMKKRFPTKKFLFSIQLDRYYANKGENNDLLKSVIKYSDYITVVSYPYAYSKYKNPQKIPKDYFSKIKELNGKKPLAIANTCYLAKDLKSKTYNAQGNPNMQNDYLKLIIETAKNQQLKFICWTIIQDYDALLKKIQENNQNQDEVFEIWKNTGLLDKDGNERKSYFLWNNYLKKTMVVDN